ncbi:hypothetical protein ACFQ0D_29290, partial [Micromonospora zhanjiangensis]
MPPMPDPPLGRPCTLVTAAAGYGKTATVRRLLRGAQTHWYDRADVAYLVGPLLDDPAALAATLRRTVPP